MEIDDWIARIRDNDAGTCEDAYFGERPAGPEVVQRLVSEMRDSPDGFTRGKFIELLGEMGDATVAPVLIEELSHAESNVRMWAVFALEELRAPEGVLAAKRYRESYPEEFA